MTPRTQKLIDSMIAAGDDIQREVLMRFFKTRANNWDLVDLSAPKLIGNWMVERR